MRDRAEVTERRKTRFVTAEWAEYAEGTDHLIPTSELQRRQAPGDRQMVEFAKTTANGAIWRKLAQISATRCNSACCPLLRTAGAEDRRSPLAPLALTNRVVRLQCLRCQRTARRLRSQHRALSSPRSICSYTVIIYRYARSDASRKFEPGHVRTVYGPFLFRTAFKNAGNFPFNRKYFGTCVVGSRGQVVGKCVVIRAP